MKKIIKKRMIFCIDVEPMERLKSYLQRAGIPMSQFFNAFVIQTADALDGLKVSKPLSEMTLSEAAGVLGRIAYLSDNPKVKKGFEEIKKVEKKNSK